MESGKLGEILWIHQESQFSILCEVLCKDYGSLFAVYSKLDISDTMQKMTDPCINA